MNDILQDSLPQEPIKHGGLSLGSIVLIIGVLMVIIVFGLQLASQNMTQPTSGPAPQFTLTTYDDVTFTLADMRGSVVVLNFWGSWCIPCRTEAPELERLSQAYADRGVQFVGVAYLDTEDDALAFMREFNVTYLNGLDAGSRISDIYHVQAVPETFIIDQEGNVAYFFAGPINADELNAQLAHLTGGTS
jgi:cytochrome c biogenesis protein CcmG, thiol:disulfide interchange protein DsbE